MTCVCGFGLCGKLYDQKQRTYRQRHGHDHVPTIHGWNVQDAGTCVWIYPLNRTGRFAHASRCSTQRWCESSNRVSHQHGRAGLNCKERKWLICNSKCLNGRTFDGIQFPPTRCFARMQLLGFKSLINQKECICGWSGQATYASPCSAVLG